MVYQGMDLISEIHVVSKDSRSTIQQTGELLLRALEYSTKVKFTGKAHTNDYTRGPLISYQHVLHVPLNRGPVHLRS